MDEKNKNIIDNNFLSRGCSAPPRLYDKNDNIYRHGCCKFDNFDWLSDVPSPEGAKGFSFVEVRFKNSRLEFFNTGEEEDLNTGDIVAVEGSPGHDVGIISLTGEAARLQMRKKKLDPSGEFKKVYRRARVSDIEIWIGAVDREENTKHRTREEARRLKLEMKINDVE